MKKPNSATSSISGSDTAQPQKKSMNGRPSLIKKVRPDPPAKKAPEKKGTLRNALRKGSGTTLSSLWSKEQPHRNQDPSEQPKTNQTRSPWGAPKHAQIKSS